MELIRGEPETLSEGGKPRSYTWRAVDNAIRMIRAQSGAIDRIASALSRTPRTIMCWERVPAERVVLVERVTGIPRQTLRPDLYEDMLEPLHHA